MLRRSYQGALLTQTLEVFHRTGALNMLYSLQTGMHAWYFECIVGPRPEIQSLKAHTNPPVQEVWHRAAECTSVHGIGIMVLHKWIKCATKLNLSLLRPIFTQKSHDHPGYRSCLHFSFEHDIVHAFWRLRNNEGGLVSSAGIMISNSEVACLYKAGVWTVK